MSRVLWPGQAKIAVSFVINYEEGAECNVQDGDAESESYLTDIPGIKPLKGERNPSAESMFAYGARVGVWRLLQLFDEHAIPVTFFATGLALERNHELAAALRTSPHEIAGHGYRWIDYRTVPKEIEKEHFQKTIDGIRRLTGKEVKGWYTGRKSPNTLDLVREFGLLYSSDSYSDDMPYESDGILFVPYSLDTNDFRYATMPGFSTGNQFYDYLKAAFDCLYREEKMMNIGLHARLSGRPGRIEALRQFVEYIKTKPHVWICRRQDIAEQWRKSP